MGFPVELFGFYSCYIHDSELGLLGQALTIRIHREVQLCSVCRVQEFLELSGHKIGAIDLILGQNTIFHCSIQMLEIVSYKYAQQCCIVFLSPLNSQKIRMIHRLEYPLVYMEAVFEIF